MYSTASKINSFLFFKLPSAYWCGVRVKKINNSVCTVQVKRSWINQNPFKSMYFAVQAMAAELSTGALIMNHVYKSGRNISILIISSKANFSKKADGVITFSCNDGVLSEQIIQKAIATGQGQTIWMNSIGTNQYGVQVCEMSFEWSIKIKN